jgi:hypothetical protein
MPESGTTTTIHDQFRRRLLNPFMLALVATTLLAGPNPALAHEEHGHPARIHEGSCQELGPVAFRLNGVGGSVDVDNAPVATPTAVNSDSAYQVMVSETTIDGTIEDLLTSEHAVMGYESDEAMDGIACGNVGGALNGETLVIGLAEAGVPGHTGFALFRPEGDQTDVLVIVGHGLAPVSGSGAEPADGHADEDEMAREQQVGEEDGHAAATPAA